MVWFRRENHGSFLTGPNVRNTQIESLLEGCCRVCGVRISSIFLFLEDYLFLDTGDDKDMYALHLRLLDRFTMKFIYHSK